jgi:hypothetical protein
VDNIVDIFDGDTQDRLYMLLCDMRIGERSDWMLPTFNHIISQTCGAFLVEHRQLTAGWQQELAELFANLQVESMLPYERTDSIGDTWAKSHRWTWGKKGEAA